MHRITGAFCRARRTVVHPKRIATNRARKAMLVNSNELGRNTKVIAALDRRYERYWAADGEVMRRYRLILSDALSRLTPWEQPPPIVNKAGSVQPVPVRTDTVVSDSS
ncbi:PPE domain-containing protein [Mycobacterium haemophilum]|uniref:PPE family protein n=1 Tax=Mycobacterium haemophilum TaxID=29311 RepID=UPI00214EC7F3|nr:PPE domain-containing protein [Mycobacterium haemophilum]